MRPSTRSSSTIGDYLIRDGAAGAELAADLANDILRDRLPRDNPDLLDNYDHERSFVYFYLYALPLLENAGLIKPNRMDEARLWGRAQTCLGMHLRYADDILDGDAPRERLALIYRRSRAYLAEAQRLLAEAGRAWGTEQEAVYVQFIDYERELAEGLSPHFQTQWRRVSPLCVIAKTYLKDGVSPAFAAAFERYLAWSLGQADCGDLLVDINLNRVTPITRLAQEIAGTTTGVGVTAAYRAHTEAKAFLDRCRPLHEETGPLWRSVITFLEMAYGPDSEAVDI